MRKIALLTVPLLVLGLFSVSADVMFTEVPTDAGPKVEVGGSTTLTFGMDLGSNATGITNTSEVDLKVTMVPKSSVDSGMMDTDDIYAYIELKDFEWVILSDDEGDAESGDTTAPSITTKLHMGPFSIMTYSAPTVEVDYVDPTDDDDGDAKDTETEYSGSGGFTLQYDIDPVTVSLGVVSLHDWIEDEETSDDTHTHDMGTDDEEDDITHTHNGSHTHGEDGEVIPVVEEPAQEQDRNDDNVYSFLAKVAIDVGDSADVELAGAYQLNLGDDDDVLEEFGIGAKATFDLGDIDPNIAFDGKIPQGGAAIPWDFGAGLTWSLSEDDKSSLAADLIVYIPGEGDPTVGTKVTLTEGDEDAGAVQGLGAKLEVALDNITGTGADANVWNVSVEGHYLTEGIKPFFSIGIGSAADAKMPFTAGLELTMIDHLTTTVQYTTPNLSGTTDDDKGDVTAALKIAY